MSLELLEKAFKALREQPPIPIAIEPDAALLLFTQLQFICRHPANTGASSEVAKEFAVNLQQIITDMYPDIGEFLETGWHPEFDEKISNTEDILKTEDTPEKSAKITSLLDLSLPLQEFIIRTHLSLFLICEEFARAVNATNSEVGIHFTDLAQQQIESMSFKEFKETFQRFNEELNQTLKSMKTRFNKQ